MQEDIDEFEQDSDFDYCNCGNKKPKDQDVCKECRWLKMRKTGFIKGTFSGEYKKYLITDRLKKYSHKKILDGYMLKIQDFPEIKYFKTLKEAQHYLEFAEAYFKTLTFGNAQDIPII